MATTEQLLQQQIAALQAQLAAATNKPVVDPLLARRGELEAEVSQLHDQIRAWGASNPRAMEIAQLLRLKEDLQATLAALQSTQGTQ